MVVQWHRVLNSALAEHDLVAVRDVVKQHLGRTPTRSELTAARRAARRYAATGHAQIGLVPVVDVGRRRTVVVLARPGVDLDDAAGLRRALAAHARVAKPQGRDTSDAAGRAERLLTQVSQAGRTASQLRVDDLEPAHAKLLAEDLTEAVAQLAGLAAILTHRSRQATTTVRDDGLPPPPPNHL